MGAIGFDSLITALTDWWRVSFPPEEGPYGVTKVEDMAKPPFKSVRKLVKDKVYFKDLTFYNLAGLRYPAERRGQWEYKSVNDELVAERHWGTIRVRHDSFDGNVTFTRATDGKQITCPAMGMAKMIYDRDIIDPEVGPQSNHYINYDTTVITKPFKYVGVNEWRAEKTRRNVEYFTFIDPMCGGFPNIENDMSRFTSAFDKANGPTWRTITGRAMLKHWEKWVIEQTRMKLIGKRRITGSEADMDDDFAEDILIY